MPPGAVLLIVRNPKTERTPMNLHIYNPEVRAKAISNQESALKAMTLNGRLSTPQFEQELEAALVKANQAPMHKPGSVTPASGLRRDRSF